METERARSRRTLDGQREVQREENTAYLNLFCHPAGWICNLQHQEPDRFVILVNTGPRAKMRRRTTSTAWIYAG